MKTSVRSVAPEKAGKWQVGEALGQAEGRAHRRRFRGAPGVQAPWGRKRSKSNHGADTRKCMETKGAEANSSGRNKAGP